MVGDSKSGAWCYPLCRLSIRVLERRRRAYLQLSPLGVRITLLETVFSPLSEDHARSRIRIGVSIISATLSCISPLSRRRGTMALFYRRLLCIDMGESVYDGDGKMADLHGMT
jgi:hypothetical protein